MHAMAIDSLEDGRRSGFEDWDSNSPISVCLLISSLEFGGAERQVIEMMRTFDRSRVRPIVCSLSSRVPLAESLPDREQWLHTVEKHGRFDFTTVFRVAALLRREKIDVVHAFLFDSEIVARLAAPLAGVRVVVSSERNADYKRPLLHRLALKLTRPLFDVMVSNSNAGKRFNIRTQGLDPSRIEVVHNGVDTERFHPNREAGLAFRTAIGIPLDAPVVGMIGSYKRQKGHDNFLRMAAIVVKSTPSARFLIVGGPVSTDGEPGKLYEQEIHRLADSLGVSQNCHFIGNQKDMNAVYNACDITALLSRREGVPNVVLESMSCGVPVVVSDIADNAVIVSHGNTGFIIPADAPGAAAAKVSDLLADLRLYLRFGTGARASMCDEFSLQRATQKLENVYHENLRSKS